MAASSRSERGHGRTDGDLHIRAPERTFIMIEHRPFHSLGRNRARLVADSVQTMSAGATIHHAGGNDGNEPAPLFRPGLRPRTHGGTPRWATCVCSRKCREGRFVAPASGDAQDMRAGALSIRADERVRRRHTARRHDNKARVADARLSVACCGSRAARRGTYPVCAARRRSRPGRSTAKFEGARRYGCGDRRTLGPGQMGLLDACGCLRS
ncbi:hypothetical protein C7402_118175 [Paraburkholderia unamae]|uniref:Uncharacterized protein n=1 Tax=Paraburkholderia unamae TaxID=219649 RepID=A0ABX5KHJ0_9BURK|nr:hypothetical protein C7402_118175 [Paraburkholderia unamae]